MLRNAHDRLALDHIGRLFTIDEAANVLGLSPNAVRLRIRRRLIGVVRISDATLRIAETEIIRLSAHRCTPAETR